jgi:hypothetical protein
VLAGVLLFAGGQLAADLFAARSPYLRDPVYADKITLLNLRGGQPSVLMVGTSRAAYGLHAGRLEQRLTAELGRPVTAFNFAVPSTGPFFHLVYTRRLLDAGVRPDLLLVEVLPAQLVDRPADPIEPRWISGDRLWRDEVELAARLGYPAAALREGWRRSWLAPAYALRLPVLARLVPSWVPEALRQNWSRITDEWGWGRCAFTQVTPELYRYGLENARSVYAGLLAEFRLGGPSCRALEELLAVTKAHGVPTVLVLMPEGADFRAFYPPDAGRVLGEYLSGLERRYGASLVDARRWVADDGFIDAHHLLASGAAAFTDRLAREAVLTHLRPAGGRP